jgi:hypothetical protein
MVKQGRNQGGKFALKSDKPRSVRTMRLTDSAWAKLGEIAESRGITRADLIEEQAESFVSGQVNQLQLFDEPMTGDVSAKSASLQQVETAVSEILNDPQVTRNGKDRGSVKRALEALLKRLS